MKFIEKFVAFVDVLGFKGFVEDCEIGTGMPLAELLGVLAGLGVGNEREKYDKYGPICCPKSRYVQRNLDFRLTQISDCVIVSTEISPAGVINLIHHCSTAVLMLLQKGIMCRGYINRGKIYHTDTQVIGSGYHLAYHNEKGVSFFKNQPNERGTPFVEVDPEVSKYVEHSQDRCIKEMYSRFVKSDGEHAALFPFNALSHSFLGSEFNAEEEHREIQKAREWLSTLRKRVLANVDVANTDALQKAQHYLRAIDAQVL